MAGTCGKDGRQQSSEANAVWQTRRKKGERETPVEVIRRVEEDLREIGVRRWRTKVEDRNEWQMILEKA
jgi:hypothetical protein